MVAASMVLELKRLSRNEKLDLDLQKAGGRIEEISKKLLCKNVGEEENKIEEEEDSKGKKVKIKKLLLFFFRRIT